MKVQYNLDGILTPSTEVEIGGSIYFIKNVYSSYYQLDMVLIEGGRLCVYYKTTDSLPQNLMVRRNYVKLYPHIGSVGMVILQNDAHDHVDADVTYDLVTCEPDETGKAYFHHRRYKASIRVVTISRRTPAIALCAKCASLASSTRLTTESIQSKFTVQDLTVNPSLSKQRRGRLNARGLSFILVS